MEMIIGTDTFQLELADSEAAAHFRSMLPLTVKMMELNGNEKYVELPGDLPTNAARVGTIEAGDLMLWGKNTLVLFYETFRSEYAYTRIGSSPTPISWADPWVRAMFGFNFPSKYRCT